MKKLLMIVALVASTLATHAQEGTKPRTERSPEDRAKMRTERLTKELGLSADQATKVQAIMMKSHERGEAVQVEQTSKGKMMRNAHDEEMKAVLTPEQYAKWQSMKDDMKAKHEEHGENGKQQEHRTGPAKVQETKEPAKEMKK